MGFDDRTRAARADVLLRITRRADEKQRGDKPFVASDRESHAEHVPLGAWGSGLGTNVVSTKKGEVL